MRDQRRDIDYPIFDLANDFFGALEHVGVELAVSAQHTIKNTRPAPRPDAATPDEPESNEAANERADNIAGRDKSAVIVNLLPISRATRSAATRCVRCWICATSGWIKVRSAPHSRQWVVIRRYPRRNKDNSALRESVYPNG